MMNYEMFKGIVQSEFKNYLTGEFKDMEIRFSVTNKVNRDLDTISLISKAKDEVAEKVMSPAIYINDMYETYKESENIQLVLQETAKKMMESYGKGDHYLPLVEDVEAVKEKIVFQLINAAQNEELLKNVPHKNFEDLAIIYRVMVTNNPGEGIATSIVTNEFAKCIGLSEEEIFRLAADNTKRLLPIKISTMEEVMRELFAKDGMPDEVIDMMVPEMPEENKMYIITNEYGINGAGSMLFSTEIGELSDKIGMDLYILPSSIHEVIAVPAAPGRDPMELADMVQTINMGQVGLEDRLSNQVYKYDREQRSLALATDTPYKRLDGKSTAVAEPNMIYETGKTKR